jgi:hypothetical protein
VEMMEHNMMVNLSVDFTAEWTWVPDRIYKFGQTFFTETLRTEDGNWILWIYFLGSENEAKNYYYKITMCNFDKTVQSMYTVRDFGFLNTRTPTAGLCLQFDTATSG